MDKPTLLFANNFMYYFFILSNFKPVIIGHTWQEDVRCIPLNLIEYYIWYMYAENNCAEVVLNKQRCLLRGYRFLSNKGVMEKLGVTDFFL